MPGGDGLAWLACAESGVAHDIKRLCFVAYVVGALADVYRPLGEGDRRLVVASGIVDFGQGETYLCANG